MASQGVGQHVLSDLGPSQHHHISYAVPHTLHLPPNTSFINQEGSSFDFEELEEAIARQRVEINNDEAKQTFYTARQRAATLEMFPSWPMKFHHTPRGSSKTGEDSADSESALNTLASREDTTATGHRLRPPQPPETQPQMEMAISSYNPTTGSTQSQLETKPTPSKRRGSGSNADKVFDAKTLRRLAQNREAAKKSRLRKKAYVQQLESSTIRLAQLEQELQKATSQGFIIGGGVSGGNISSGAALFDMEYARWLDDDHRHMSELRTALQAHLSDSDLRIVVDKYIAHYDEIFCLKEVAAVSDAIHLITGIWTTPAERCFLWMGGFRPSDLIKMLLAQLDTLTEHQVVGIYSLQQSSQQAEEALSQGLEQLQQSLIGTIANGSVNDTMHHMAVALGKLTGLESFIRQADHLRRQTLYQMRRILTIRQAARCFLVIGEYYGRLRALSSLWASRPRENFIADDNSCQTSMNLQMVLSSPNQFSNF
ncbi:transcription factor TGA9-like [Olea europaea var. sylvestris]|uniref:transcription factor TGA9-like n=1 Tax=Olea europaea var. sylvestris TaxID=158386 RepID=UPI000C1CD493|nr:transcription factor TGA9-like [Olea europaea var. sylvestris]